MNEESEDGKEISQDEWLSFLRKSFSECHIPYTPTQEVPGDSGIRFDFCYGCRILIPENASRKYRVVLVNTLTGTKLFDGTLIPGDYYVSRKRYYVPYGIQITESETGKRIFQHKYDAKGMNVLVRLPVETLGDTLAWFESVPTFADMTGCNASVRIADYLVPLFKKEYPSIDFVDDSGCESLRPYAAYTVAIFHHDEELDCSPCDYRQVPLWQIGYRILGCGDAVRFFMPPKISRCDFSRPEKKYVCIASQASGGFKLWANPKGWDEVVKHIQELGYDVYDVDRESIIGNGVFFNRIPPAAIDMTGDRPIVERAEMLRGASFFVGLPSGLSWLAESVGTPVVMIGGFTDDWYEFPCYRAMNTDLCHGCFNDVRCEYDHSDFLWCPRHRNTRRMCECSRGISARLVIKKIDECIRDNAGIQ